MVNAAEAYRRNQVLNAPPEQLTLMLYNGCLKFIDEGTTAMSNKDYEISHQLMPLYDYVYDRLISGNVQSDIKQLEEARDIIKELRDAWVGAMKKARAEKGLGKGGRGYA